MKNTSFKRLGVLVFILVFSSFIGEHDYYVSTTKISFDAENQKVLLRSRFFLDDFAAALRNQFNKSFTFGGETQTKNLSKFVSEYYTRNVSVSINNKAASLKFVTMESSNDLMVCSFVIDQVSSIKSLEVSFQPLLHFIEEQQNILYLDVNGKRSNAIQTNKKPTSKFEY